MCSSGDLCGGEQAVIEGYKLKLMCGSHEKPLHPAHTLTQSDVRGGAIITLKMHGLLGGGGGQTKLSKRGTGVGVRADGIADVSDAVVGAGAKSVVPLPKCSAPARPCGITGWADAGRMSRHSRKLASTNGRIKM